MNKSYILFIASVITLFSCSNEEEHKHNKSHGHSHSEIEPIAYTIYTNKTELFVEFKPLIKGQTSKFAAHFTTLGENFKPVTEGSVSFKLIGENDQPSFKSNNPSSPGIFRLSLKPINTGNYDLVFLLQTKEFTDTIIIKDISVYPNEESAKKDAKESSSGDYIPYLKEQAWKVEFANALAERLPFNDILKTNGQILPAPGDEIVVTAGASGIVKFTENKSIIGSEVAKGTSLFTISGGNLSVDNLDANYSEAKANYNKAKLDFERVKELIQDKIVSQKEYLQAKVAFENAQTTFNTIAKNYSASGQSITSPMYGFIKNILVNEGQFVEAGTPLVVISKNSKLILQANVSQKYFNKLPTITAANFKPVGIKEVFNTKMLNGKVVSYGKSAVANSPFLPISFEIDNIGNLIPGSVAEVYLKSTPILNALVIPVSALMEELGNFYVFVQVSGESFQKREVKIGASDAKYVQVLSGINEGERVVTRGAYNIKLSSASGEIPAHGHEH